MSNITISPLNEKIIEMKINGYSNKEIAEILAIPVKDINSLMQKEEFKKLLNDTIAITANTVVAKHINTLSSIIDAKLNKLLEDGEDLSKATKKDIVDIVNVINTLASSKEKNSKEETKDTYVQILNSITKE